jgi:uncharacterized membrane protein YraQ (UPF0718 family)
MRLLAGFARELADILLDSGLWLMAGFLLAGLVHVFVPIGWVRRHLGGRGPWPIIKAALMGIPLPLCSCSVIPAAAQLRREGAGKGAAASFAVSTPETGEESIALTWALMGPIMALIRPVAALATAITTGLLINAFVPDDQPSTPARNDTRDRCCSTPDAACSTTREPPGRRLARALRYAFVELPADLAPWLLGGLALSALMGAVIPPGWIESHLGKGMGPMLIMLAVSLPLYVCATSSTPVAAMLIAKGLSPGAALVFLLAGPATNTATMAWVAKDLGWRALAIYLAVISAAALLLGAAVDMLPTSTIVSNVAATEPGTHGPLAAAGAALLTAVLVAGLWRRFRGPSAGEPADAPPTRWAP